ncbi:DUF4232 domain-containing protein [Streptomyces sp. NPDC001922]|uniref:DUF4232 domain-containing protein n=1 Tax=Streptomyces sp. NPDC001922 TaxID=3364624 RepID=UPI0036802D30
MSAFISRRRTGLLAATTAALAAFSLTACQDNPAPRDEGAGAPASSQTAQSGGGTADGTTDGAKSGGGAQGSVPSGETGDAAGARTRGAEPGAPAPTSTAANGGSQQKNGRVTCTGANTKVTAKKVARPLNHMLITVTNTGSRSCDLYSYPAVQFGEAQSVPPVFEESKPQSVLGLAPGESGYAGVRLSAADGSGSGGHTEKTLAVSFFDARGNGVGPVAHPSLPGTGVHIDDSLRVTYWLSSAEDALEY